MTQIPLYFLPGTQCDHQLWQRVFELLPSYFEPHAVVLPIGKSPLHIVELLHQQLPNEHLNLVGFSLGGYLAALYASTYSTTLNKLMILANAPYQLPEQELERRQQTLAFVQEYGYKAMPNKRIMELLSPVHHDNADVIKVISDMDIRGGQTMLVNQLSSTSERIDLIPSLVTLPIDIKFVIGEDDCLVNIAQLDKGLATSNITLDILAQCGHMSPLESPQTLANMIITYFEMPFHR